MSVWKDYRNMLSSAKLVLCEYGQGDLAE